MSTPKKLFLEVKRDQLLADRAQLVAQYIAVGERLREDMDVVNAVKLKETQGRLDKNIQEIDEEIRGIEKKLKFRITHHPGATSEDLSMSKIVDRIILGPTVSSPLSAAAFKRMLEEHGETDLIPRVFASTIPFRHNG